ncbi:MAG: hypothetical protein F6K16_42980 [Symploca sp. SIO2B6]|nr:hypothetical protein [Symploca sp. SIO2B6]
MSTDQTPNYPSDRGIIPQLSTTVYRHWCSMVRMKPHPIPSKDCQDKRSPEQNCPEQQVTMTRYVTMTHQSTSASKDSQQTGTTIITVNTLL